MKAMSIANNATDVNSGSSNFEHDEWEKCWVSPSSPKGYGFGQGAGTLGMDTGEHLGNKSGSEMS